MELAALICCFFSISCVGCARCADDVPRNSGPSHHPTLAPPARPLIYSQPPPKTTHIVYPQPSSLQYGTFSQQRTETDRLVKAQELIRKAEEQERIRKIEERQRVQRAEEQKALAELRRRQELLEESRRGQHQPAAIENERNRRKAERTLEYQRQQALLEAERNKNWPPLKSQRQQVVTKSPKKQQSQRQKKPQPPSPRPSRPGRSSSAEVGLALVSSWTLGLTLFVFFRQRRAMTAIIKVSEHELVAREILLQVTCGNLEKLAKLEILCFASSSR